MMVPTPSIWRTVMDYKIVPLAYTHPDWPTFIKVCQEHLGYSPTRGIDDQGIAPKDPASFLACLPMDNQPLKNLRTGITSNYTFHHVMFSFIAILDKKAVDALYYHIDLEIHCKPNEDEEYVTVISGTMDKWYHAVVKGCTEHSPRSARKVMNACFNFFRQIGYRELWTGFIEKELTDGTFIIWRGR